MSNRRAVPVSFTAAGLSDAFSVDEAFPGAMSVLQNLILYPGGRGHWVPRPAAFTLVTNALTSWGSFLWGGATWDSGWGAITNAGVVTGLYVVGDLAFGMVSITGGTYNGLDQPFCYNIKKRQFIDITIDAGAASLPTSPPATGDWTPPRFASFPGRVVVTHPGFSAVTGRYVGFIDYSGFVSSTITGNVHNNSTTVDNLSANVIQAGWEVGDSITGTNIPAGSYIVSIATNGLSVVISNQATGNANGTLLTVSGGTSAVPVWGSGNTALNSLVSVPVDVFNFNGRAYYAVPGGGMQFSDVGIPLQITNATQALTPDNGLDITCFGGLPINQTQTGPISTLFAFQGDSNIVKVTGDEALSNLIMNSVPNGIGTLAPNSLASTPLGLMFIAPDGLRYVDFDGNASPVIGNHGDGVNIPILNALYVSRINAAYNENIYRFSLQNGEKANQPWEDYWFHITDKIFSGPHTDPSVVIAPYQQEAGVAIGHGFFFAMQGFPDSLYLGSTYPVLQSLYAENGTNLQCVWQTCYTADNEMLTENSIVESTLFCALPAQSNMAVLVLNEKGTVLDQLALPTVSTPSTIWKSFNWGSAIWGVTLPGLAQIDLPWTKPIVYKQAALRITVNSAQGLRLGAWRYNNIVLGYRLETFGVYV